MLDLYIGECMIPIININIGIKEPTWGYHIVILVSSLFNIFGVSQGERILVDPISCLGLYNSKPYDTMTILPRIDVVVMLTYMVIVLYDYHVHSR